MITFDHLRIRLSAHTAHADGTHQAAQRRVMHTLASLDLTPRGLPPNAILIVRRLPDPKPGALLEGGTRVWENQARAELERLWRQAARPLLETVSSTSEAVWFSDYAEWLACISLDLHQGVAHLRWWWQTLLSTTAIRYSTSPLAMVWREHARWLPAAFASIHESGHIALPTMASKLSSQQRDAVWRAVSEAHHLPAVPNHSIPLQGVRRWIPNAARLEGHAQDVSDRVETFILYALAAYYAPAALRHALRYEGPRGAKTSAEAALLSANSQAVQRTDARNLENVPKALDSIISPPLTAFSAEVDKAADENASFPSHEPSVSPIRVMPEDEPRAFDPIFDSSTQTKVFSNLDSSETVSTVTDASVVSSAPKPSMTSTPKSARQTSEHPLEQPEGFMTGLGRMWFLINLLVALDLLDDDLSTWLKVEMLARWLLGNLAPDFSEDPLWQSLFALAKSENTPEARNRAVDWLDENGDTIKTYLDARLDDLGPTLWIIPARVYITRTHIDVMFSMDAIDLSIRRAGLDRDPGWVAEIAHVILFHFE